MKCLSVQQPWAWLLVNGHKDVENRTWSTKVRGWVLVHAGQTVDLRALASVAVQRPDITLPTVIDLPRGCIVGAMRIDDCVMKSTSPWFSAGGFGFVIGAAHKFERPVPQRGMLGFFKVEPADIHPLWLQITADLQEGAA